MDSEHFDKCTDCDSSLVHSDRRHFYLPSGGSNKRKDISFMKKTVKWLSVFFKGAMVLIDAKGKIRAERQRWKKQPKNIDWRNK